MKLHSAGIEPAMFQLEIDCTNHCTIQPHARTHARTHAYTKITIFSMDIPKNVGVSAPSSLVDQTTVEVYLERYWKIEMRTIYPREDVQRHQLARISRCPLRRQMRQPQQTSSVNSHTYCKVGYVTGNRVTENPIPTHTHYTYTHSIRGRGVHCAFLHVMQLVVKGRPVCEE